MQRHETTTLSGLDPAYLAAKEKLAAGKTLRRPLPKRQYGRTKEKLSILLNIASRLPRFSMGLSFVSLDCTNYSPVCLGAWRGDFVCGMSLSNQ